MSNNNNKNEIVINSFIHNPDVLSALQRLNLRMFYTSDLYVAETTKGYNEIIDSYIKCEIQSPKPGKIDYISADADNFSLIMYIQKNGLSDYTYSKLSYYDKTKKKTCHLENSNSNNNPNLGTTIKRLLFRKK